MMTQGSGTLEGSDLDPSNIEGLCLVTVSGDAGMTYTDSKSLLRLLLTGQLVGADVPPLCVGIPFLISLFSARRDEETDPF